ncbi:MAG: CotH kinase family protein [Eubacteriales bacterium]|nr:CotH kinase family protein [Eubacteriales bacterium]
MYVFFQKKALRIVWLLLILTACIWAGILCLKYFIAAGGHVVINEVCSSNFSVVSDENGEYADYVELYNPTDEEISLEGYYLSDDIKEPHQCDLTGVVIPAKGYALIWLDGSGRDAYHARFRLSRDGDVVFLSDSFGRILDTVAVPALSYNTVYARIGDNGKDWAKMTPTARTGNSEAQVLRSVELEEPVLTVESGFYDAPFELGMTAARGLEIYYTLDGSDPTPDSFRYETPLSVGDASSEENIYAARTDLAPSSQYTPPFLVDKATVVRAIAYDPETDTVSDIVTKSYFVGFDQRTDYDGFPVLSLVTDPDNLFDREYGIYTNGVVMEEYIEKGGLVDGRVITQINTESGGLRFRYMASNAYNRGKQWERESTIAFFDSGHEYCFTQDVGIRISGQSTRGAAQKSLNLFGRDIYDDIAEFPYQFFPGMSYSTIKLRNGGSENAASKIMDAFLQSLFGDRAVSVQASTPCIVFLNGEYWGIYNIRERYKEEYLENHFGVSPDNVWMIDSGSAGIGSSAAQDAYDQMIGFVAGSDMSAEENYAAACSLLDVQSLIDFYCVNLYIDNMDMGFGQNMALWRTAEPEDNVWGDCRWRWMVFDVDGSLTGYDNNTFTESEPWQADFDLMDEPLMVGLMQNEQFKRQFCLSFFDIANTNFAYETVHDSLMEWKELYQTQVVNSHRRFLREDYSEEEFENYIEAFDSFFENRLPYVAGYLADEFGLTGSLETVTIRTNQPEGGYVIVNTASVVPDPEWSGQYFTDYPITVTAVPEEGYEFAGWSGAASSGEAQIEVEITEGGVTLEAEFRKAA